VNEQRFEALDAWRGICAVVVALEHLNIDSPIVQNGLIRHGARFVDFFFVLSGFVIAHAYRDRLQRDAANVRVFLLRRIGRLWPLHFFVLLALVAVETLLLVLSHAGISLGREAFSERNTLTTFPLNLLLVHSWGLLDRLTWNTPSWSISVEFFAYAFFASCCVLARRFLNWTTVIVLAASLGVLLLVSPVGMQSTYDFGLVRCMYGFTFGVMVRELWGRHRLHVGTVGEVLVGAATVAAVILLPVGPTAAFVTPVFALAVWVFASEAGAVSRGMRMRPFQLLGAWSYSIYMVHLIIALGMLVAAMLATRRGVHVFSEVNGNAAIVGPFWFTAMVIVAYCALVIAFARTTYRYVELPGQRLFRNLASSAR